MQEYVGLWPRNDGDAEKGRAASHEPGRMYQLLSLLGTAIVDVWWIVEPMLVFSR